MKTTIFGLVVLLFLVASVSSTVYFEDSFDDGDEAWKSRWIHSNAADAGQFVLDLGEWYGDAEKSKGIKTSQDAKFYHLSAKMDEVVSNKDKDLVIQFSVKHAQGIDCGGGYVKVLTTALDQADFNGDSEYGIMFGPDICGPTKKIHLIFNYKGENLLWKKTPAAKTDKLTHVYTLILRPDNTYEVLVDNGEVESGNLVDDWSFLPPKMIKDPSMSKPDDWVDEKMMDDPEASKPEDWDAEPEFIADPDASKPEDWDEDLDGDWESPQIVNPAYQGIWTAPKIENPLYKGEWVHPEIENPEYFEDDMLYLRPDMKFIGLDLWQVKSGTIFDNFLVTDDVNLAHEKAHEAIKIAAEEKVMFEDMEAKKREEEEERRKKEEEERRQKEEEEEEEDDDDEEEEDDDDEEEEDDDDDKNEKNEKNAPKHTEL